MAGLDIVFIPGTLMPPSCFDKVALPEGATSRTLDWMRAVRPCRLEAVVAHVLSEVHVGTPTILVGHSTVVPLPRWRRWRDRTLSRGSCSSIRDPTWWGMDQSRGCSGG